MIQKETRAQFLKTLLKHKNIILISVATCSVLSMIWYKFVPKDYKITAAINVPTQYFQIPLVRDFLSETFDGSELKAQRESLIRRSINHDYLRSIGIKYNLFKATNSSEITTDQLNTFSKKFEIIPLGAAGFLIGFFANDPQVGYKVVQDVIIHIRENLGKQREATLRNVHSAIQDRLEALSFTKQTAGSQTILAARPDLVQQEVARIEEEIKALKTTYSDKHPRVTELNQRLQELAQWLNPSADLAHVRMTPKNFSGERVDVASKELFQDLLKKYHYLEVVLFLDKENQKNYLNVTQEPFVPTAAIWPKRPIFLAWGVVIGFLIGALIALAKETMGGRIWSLSIATIFPARVNKSHAP